jgi:uncharacterized protein
MSDSKNSPLSFALLGLFIGAGLMGGSYIFSQSFESIKLANQTLEVKGVATKKIVSDYGTWTGSIVATASTSKAAYELLATQKGQVLEFMKKEGFPLDQIKLAPATVVPEFNKTAYGSNTPEVAYYTAKLRFILELPDVQLVDKLSKKASEINNLGVQFESENPRFVYRKLDEIKIELLGKAAEDAKIRALKLAQSVGNKVGALRSARQGVFQITYEGSQETSDYGISDTTTINKDVRAVVTMSFAIEK